MESYLYAIDLYNYAYWWECHESLECLWLTAGQNTMQGNFFRALIQLTASNLKRFVGYGQAADNLTSSGITRLGRVSDFYMGIDVASLMNYLNNHRGEAAPLIRLNG